MTATGLSVLTKARLWLIRIQSAPYDGQLATLGVDAALACGAFGQSVAVLLDGPGRELLQEQPLPAGADRNLYKLVSSFPLYDLGCVYVASDSAARDSINGPEGLEVIAINRHDVAELIATSRHVLSF